MEKVARFVPKNSGLNTYAYIYKSYTRKGEHILSEKNFSCKIDLSEL